MRTKVLKYLDNLAQRDTKVRSFLISFYVVGVIGMVIPLLRPLFIQLTPFAPTF